jgi:ThiF family
VFHELASHNEDLKRLLEKGYAITEDHGYLVIRDIPYVDGNGVEQKGAIVTKLVDVDGRKVKQEDHQIFFAGSHPHHIDSTPISGLAGGATGLALASSPDVVVQRSFSNKPDRGYYFDFFEKIENYVGIISGPAIEKYGANPYTFRLVEGMPSPTVFKFRDTLSSRAEIVDLSSRFADDIVAVIGLGGTGSYLLDFLVKTPVKQIRGFDPDDFHVHTAYRSPGRLQESELGKKKAAVYQSRYETFRDGLSLESRYIDAHSHENLTDVTFAFVCVDKGTSRAGIFDILIANRIPFIDVGMGLNRNRGSINGMLRATYYSSEDAQRLREMDLAELADHPDDEYRVHIQISELNALNAALAVLKFKQIRGFYLDDGSLNSLVFEVGDVKTVNEAL